MKEIYFNQRRIEQINGREGETATLLLRCPLNVSGLGGGFAPRHLKRSTFLGVIELVFLQRSNSTAKLQVGDF